jgi:hypothetical protein
MNRQQAARAWQHECKIPRQIHCSWLRDESFAWPEAALTDLRLAFLSMRAVFNESAN